MVGDLLAEAGQDHHGNVFGNEVALPSTACWLVVIASTCSLNGSSYGVVVSRSTGQRLDENENENTDERRKCSVERRQTGGRDSQAAKSRWDGTGGGVYLKGTSSCQHCLARLNAWE